VEEPRTHYQISLTARQAVGLFAMLLAALGLAYFFGLMTGLSGRDGTPKTAEEPVAAAPEPGTETLELPPIETAVPTAAASLGSRTDLAGVTPGAPVSFEPTVPAVIETFDDGSADETSALADASPGKAPPPAPARPAAGAASSGKYWVQVASLTSREEAGALSGRLSRRGFPSQLLTAMGPKGKVYRVRVGPYKSEGEASRAADRLTRQEKIKGPWVVPDGK
jgi:cell division septation protein DedD